MNSLLTPHIGNNIRCMRLLRGIKQTAFAAELGIAQQNVSKMEKKNKISDEQLDQVAKILKTTAEAIKSFDDNVTVNNNIFSNDQHVYPVKDVIGYFQDELGKKDEEIKQLRAALEAKEAQENSKSDSLEKKFKMVK